MARTLIQQYASSMVGGLMGRVTSLRGLDHRLTKGELRELFVSGVLRSFLTEQFDIGCGVIVNQRGAQSRQTDVIIYDNRIVPPFIREQRLGVYPAESVLATIEVKSRMTKAELLRAESSALDLKRDVYDQAASIYPDFATFTPLCAVLGFYGNGVKELTRQDAGRDWLASNVNSLDYMCLVNKWSWMTVQRQWAPQMGDPDGESFDETKRFLAVLLDNVRTHSEARLNVMREEHRDWLGAYIRE